MSANGLNRRRFLGYSAAAGIALTHPAGGDAAHTANSVRVGLVGVGNRGTALARALLELGTARVVAVCDIDSRNRHRAQGIVEKATGERPEACERVDSLVARADVDAVVAAVPCDQHTRLYQRVLESGKHLYAEKPLAICVEDCDALIATATSLPELVFHIGYQRRSNPRFVDGIERLKRGDFGTLIECACSWSSSNGPMEGNSGWLGQRARSGDWMLEQAVHLWDVLCWSQGGPPASAVGHGRQDIFPRSMHLRDVTDFYVANLTWANGFTASVRHSWIDPPFARGNGVTMQFVGSEGALELVSGLMSMRDRKNQPTALRSSTSSDSALAITNFISAINTPTSSRAHAPSTLSDAKLATQVGLLVRRAVDERRVVTWDELFGSAG